MSAEGKKKRGEAGISNAKSIPFRYNGYPRGYTLSTRTNRTNHKAGAGSRLVQAMALGIRLPGYKDNPILLSRTDEAMSRCTHPMLTPDD